jgi:fido (protein-threonine AMPylation protein)
LNAPDDYTWQQIKAFGVKLSITSPSDYARTVEKGVLAAKSVAQGFTSGPWVDSGQVTTLHWAMMKDVYPWAGSFRTIGLRKEGEFFSEPALIRSDLKSLNMEARNWFKGEDLRETAKQVAAYNAAFYKIHPFLEGNYLVGKVILEHQVREVFGKEINLAIDERVYRATLEKAMRGDFSQLANQILEHAGLSRTAQSMAVEKLMREGTRQLKERESGMEHSW